MNVAPDWKSRKLTDLAEYINGYAFKPEDWSKYGLPIIRIEQLRNPDSISDYYYGFLPEHNIIDNGDLIFSWSASLFLSIWKDGMAALNQHLFKVIEKEGVDRHFLKQFIEFHLPEITKVSHGSTMQHITRKELDRFRAMFPCNKPEQSKIAEILSTVDQAIEQTEASIAKHQRIKTGLMQVLLTRGIDKDGNIRSEETHEFKDSQLGRIPVEWEVERIEQKLDCIIDYRGRTPTKVETGVRLLTAKNVRDGYIDEEPREFIAESAFNSWMTRGVPKPGDVLFTTEAPMGNVALVPEYRIALAQRLLTLCPKPDELSQDYLFWLLRWRRSTERLELLTSGSTVTGVKQSVFRKVEFRFPGLEEQRRISVILNSLDSASRNQRSNLTKFRSLKTALMQDLLTGKVRVTPLLTEAEVGA